MCRLVPVEQLSNVALFGAACRDWYEGAALMSWVVEASLSTLGLCNDEHASAILVALLSLVQSAPDGLSSTFCTSSRIS